MLWHIAYSFRVFIPNLFPINPLAKAEVILRRLKSQIERDTKKESREKKNASLKARYHSSTSIGSTGGENSVAESVADSSLSVESEGEKQKSGTPEASTVSLVSMQSRWLGDQHTED